MTNLNSALKTAIEYIAPTINIPPDVWQEAIKKRLYTKATGETLEQVSAGYHNEITEILTGYFEGGSITAPRNAFKRSTIESFDAVFGIGWLDGGGALPPDDEAAEWFDVRVEAELGYIEMLFQEAKELRKDSELDFFAWVTARADGYSRTLKEIYNQAKLRAMKNIMVTFDGDDGAESCEDCQKYKGQRHKISWFVSRNAVPPFGTGLECHRGGRCQHGLFNDDGEQITA